MQGFRLTNAAIDIAPLRLELAAAQCGGYASFEGWVRDHNEGQQVLRLEYQSYEPLALREGERIISEARERFAVPGVLCIHRMGLLEIGDIAVWVAASAPHRDEAFRACRYVIDEVKHRVPIWKKEHYVNGNSGWVNCERCAAAAGTGDGDGDGGQLHAHAHSHSH